MFWTYAYRAVTTLSLPFLVIVSLGVAKWRVGLRDKLGILFRKPKLKKDKRIWLHAVSYGEVRTILPLVEALSETLPEYAICISTGTLTGQKLANELFRTNDAPLADLVFYAPFDQYWAVKSWLTFLQPSILIIMETELWPELIRQTQDGRIPCLIINARLTEKSVSLYNLVGPLLRPLMQNLDLVLAQSKLDRSRYLAIGCDPEKTIALGNLKLDGLVPATPVELNDLRKTLSVGEHDRIIVAGSTHPGEEELICQAFCKIDRPNLKLFLAPRHIERSQQLYKLCRSYNLATTLFSELEADYKVLIVDRMGLLTRLYGLGNIALLGGTWAKIGGHNPLEPAVYQLPILVGPYTYKITELAQLLQELGLLTMAIDEKTLLDKLLELLKESPLSHRPSHTPLGKPGDISQKISGYIHQTLNVDTGQTPPISEL